GRGGSTRQRGADPGNSPTGAAGHRCGRSAGAAPDLQRALAANGSGDAPLTGRAAGLAVASPRGGWPGAPGGRAPGQPGVARGNGEPWGGPQAPAAGWGGGVDPRERVADAERSGGGGRRDRGDGGRHSAEAGGGGAGGERGTIPHAVRSDRRGILRAAAPAGCDGAHRG